MREVSQNRTLGGGPTNECTAPRDKTNLEMIDTRIDGLVCEFANYRQRMTEILSHAHGPVPQDGKGCVQEVPSGLLGRISDGFTSLATLSVDINQLLSHIERIV